MEGARVKETEQSDGHKLCYGWDEPTNQPKKKKRDKIDAALYFVYTGA